MGLRPSTQGIIFLSTPFRAKPMAHMGQLPMWPVLCPKNRPNGPTCGLKGAAPSNLCRSLEEEATPLVLYACPSLHSIHLSVSFLQIPNRIGSGCRWKYQYGANHPPLITASAACLSEGQHATARRLLQAACDHNALPRRQSKCLRRGRWPSRTIKHIQNADGQAGNPHASSCDTFVIA